MVWNKAIQFCHIFCSHQLNNFIWGLRIFFFNILRAVSGWNSFYLLSICFSVSGFSFHFSQRNSALFQGSLYNLGLPTGCCLLGLASSSHLGQTWPNHLSWHSWISLTALTPRFSRMYLITPGFSRNFPEVSHFCFSNFSCMSECPALRAIHQYWEEKFAASLVWRA